MSSVKPPVPFRIGIGYDSHRLVSNRALRLGGVDIPSERGTLGHSDGDAVIHAVCDALLGACAMGDIGTHFPDTDPRYEGIDSRQLLEEVVERLHRAGWALVNVDITVVLERPKLRPRIVAMRSELADILGVGEERVGMKAKTNEGLDAVGAGEAVVAYAVAMVYRRSDVA